MNKTFLITILNLLFIYSVKAQVLEVNLVIQEQNEWCWDAVSKCVLNYYGNSIEQCEIAEFTRTVATWHNYGSVNCCQSPDGECNYWNYNWGYAGSIQDILVHFGKIQNYGSIDSLTVTEVSAEINNKRPFIIYWAWTSGGGHFVVAHGIKDNLLYYMNPWPGEGLKIALYDWVVSSPDHKWKGTNRMSTNIKPNAVAETLNKKTIKIYPNPSNGNVTLEMNSNFNSFKISILSMDEKVVYYKYYQDALPKLNLDLTHLSNGIYFVLINSEGFNSTNRIVIHRD